MAADREGWGETWSYANKLPGDVRKEVEMIIYPVGKATALADCHHDLVGEGVEGYGCGDAIYLPCGMGYFDGIVIGRGRDL